MGKTQAGSRYAARCERFARDLAFAAVHLAQVPEFTVTRHVFDERIEQAARDLDSHGLSSPDWRGLVNGVAERTWILTQKPALLPRPDTPFSARGYRALVARDRCGCGHERLHHYDRGGSTVGCSSCGCGTYALAGESAARPRTVVHA